MDVGDIALVDGHKTVMIMGLRCLGKNKDQVQGYMVSFFGSQESAWYSSKVSLHIPREDRTLSEMKDLLDIINKL